MPRRSITCLEGAFRLSQWAITVSAPMTSKAVRISSLDELQPGTLGIPEPVNDRETAGIGSFSLALIPCVSAWKDGRRMGHGVGYYDRFLVDRHCKKFCLCYEALLSEQIPMDAHDIPMDAVVTEREIYTR